MDTWATSSVTPQIQSHWLLNQGQHSKLFPMDIRPQAHEIIRTWAFYTIVKAWMHEGEIPWKHALISGWVLDPEGNKMSKSKGNVVTPQSLGCDPLLGGACSSRHRYCECTIGL
jgi:valyl-tRNA synthetase